VPLPAPVATLPLPLLDTPPGTLAGNRSDKDWMPSAKLQYQLLPSAMVYFSFAQGFKAGGFNGSDTTGLAASMPYAPEHVNAYELGLKSQWLDDTLLFNADVFRSNYRNLQVVVEQDYQAGNGVAVVRNAAASRSQGVEIEGQWLPVRSLRLGANITYLDSYYISFPNAAPTALEQIEGFNVQDLSGHPTEYAPRWSGSLSGAFTTTVGEGMKFTAALMPFFTSSYDILASEDPAGRQADYVRLDARLTLETQDGHWAFDVIGKNLTDRVILNFTSIVPTSPGTYVQAREETRNVAGQVRFRW
jgi:iron complex outermembrane recepter protein